MGKLKTLIAAFACAFLLHAPAPDGVAQTPLSDPDKALDRAVELHKAGDVVGAVHGYQAILAQHPGRADVRSNLGAAYAQLGRFEEAIAEYKRALAADAGNVAVRFNLALAFYKAAYFAEAAGELAQVVAAQPQNYSAVLLLADSQLRLGEYKKVVDLLSPLEASLGNERAFAYILGTALIQDKQVDRGQLLIDRILRAGDSAEARVMMGAAHLMTRDYQSAIAEFERAVALNPKLPTLRALYGRALMLTGETERAARAFRGEMEINPNDFEANLFLGMLLKKEARNEEALSYLQRAAQVRPNDVTARYQTASVHLAAGRVAEAQRLLEEVVKAEPELVEAHVLLATVYYRLKRKADGDRERAIVQKLQAARQANQPGAQESPDNSAGGKPPESPDAAKKP